MMAPQGKGGEPQGELARALENTFGTVDKFRETLTQAGLTRFGSGWAWLAWGKGKLSVVSSPNQDPICLQGLEPLLCVDVWEHAYYLKYQNRRADYLKNWWNVVNWNDVAERFNQVQKGR
jgi:Fe-Mn family superoxide dismutase